jgi:hypothetical protein
VDAGEEISGGLVVARGKGAVLFELAVEILDEVACLVHFFIESARVFAIALRRDHQVFSCRAKRFDHPLVGIEGFVCHQSAGLHLRKQHVGPFQVMGLARGEEEGKRLAQGVDQTMDFGAQPAFAASDRLIFAVFFWAPALCWWARTMVLSIMAYSLSASDANISNIVFHTPLLAQRENLV